MGLYQRVKAVIPLKPKVAFHRYKTLPNDLAARARNRLGGQPPIPERDLIHLVAGHRSAQWFLRGGRTASGAIREALNKQGIDIDQFDAVLDFGCGCGRIMRQWIEMRRPAWYGTDYNPVLIDWCKRHLAFAEFRVNPLCGRLSYETEMFDFIYAFSVFTHLNESLQFYWINELSRMLRPGGYVYFTTHGEYYLPTLSEKEQAQFRRGQLVVRGSEQPGSNICSAYHPTSYVRETMARELTLVDFVPSGAKGESMHDRYLLRKPS